MRIHIGKLFSQHVQLNVLMIGFTTMVVGCGGLQLDEHVTKYGRPLSDPTSPPASITLEPVQTTNPINTQFVASSDETLSTICPFWLNSITPTVKGRIRIKKENVWSGEPVIF